MQIEVPISSYELQEIGSLDYVLRLPMSLRKKRGKMGSLSVVSRKDFTI